MRRPWELDRSLSHVPVGWRRIAATVMALASEHCIAVAVAIRWSAEPNPYCPSLAILDTPLGQLQLPAHRAGVQFVGRAVMDRVAARALTVCMACGTTSSPPAHVELQLGGKVYIALLCAECEDGAALDGGDFWYVIGRLDPLILERDRLDEDYVDGDEEPGKGEDTGDGRGSEDDWLDEE